MLFIEVLLQVRCQGQEDQEQACAEPQQDGCSAAGGGNAAQAEPGVPGWLNLAFATSDHCNWPWHLVTASNVLSTLCGTMQ